MADFPIGFKAATNRIMSKIKAEDRVREEAVKKLRNSKASAPNERAPMDVVMIVDNTGRTDDIVVGKPPVLKREYLEELEKRRQEIGIEKLFR